MTSRNLYHRVFISIIVNNNILIVNTIPFQVVYPQINDKKNLYIHKQLLIETEISSKTQQSSFFFILRFYTFFATHNLLAFLRCQLPGGSDFT